MLRASSRHSWSAALFLGALLLLTATLGLALLPGPVTAQSEPTPLPLFALPDPRISTAISSNMLALGEDNRTLVVANMLNNTISLLQMPAGTLRAEIPVGRDPRTIALTDDATRAVTANRADGTLSLVNLGSQQVQTIDLDGIYPYGVVVRGNDIAYASLQGSDQVVEVDLNSAEVTRRFRTADQPTGLALWGDFLYVTHFWSGQLSLIYLPTGRLVQTISTGLDTSASPFIEVDVTRGLAYMPQSRSNASNLALTYDSIIFPVVNVLDLRSLTVLRDERIALDTADRPVNLPLATALDRFREWLYVANSGSDSVSVIDLNTGLARANIPVGSNPRGLLLNRDSTLLLVYNVFDGTLTIIETRTFGLVDEISISDFNIPVDTLVASQLFYTAVDPRTNYGGWVSCANCHFDGTSDGRVWQGFPDGARNTPLLFNLVETAPYNWSGTWDELADVELRLRSLQGGVGLIAGGTAPPLGAPHSGLSIDLDSLARYIGSLQGPPNPDGLDAGQIERGRLIFEQQDCATCHIGAAGTDLQKHDVGTGVVAGTEFDTPSLRWLWLSAPYFHDGSAVRLPDVFIRPGAHQLIGTVSLDDIQALAEYLLSLPE